MKLLLIGVLTLGTFSCFAGESCKTWSKTGNYFLDKAIQETEICTNITEIDSNTVQLNNISFHYSYIWENGYREYYHASGADNTRSKIKICRKFGFGSLVRSLVKIEKVPVGAYDYAKVINSIGCKKD